MKLNDNQVETIQAKTGLSPIPAEAAEDSGLKGHFGDETFYLDSKGVYVFEEVRTEGDGIQAVVPPAEKTGESVTAIQIAAVEPGEEEGAVSVRSIQPQATTLTVALVE